MRTLIGRGSAFVGLVGLVVALGACSESPESVPASSVDPMHVQEAVDSLNTSFIASMAARDTDAVATFYADDVLFLPPQGPRMDGRSHAREYWAGVLKLPGLFYEMKSLELVASEAGDVVVDVGSYDMRWRGPNGAVVTDVGKYVQVLKPIGGDWKIVAYAFNSDQPAAGP